MTTNDYRPIDCGLYSEYEVLAMRRSWVALVVTAEDGSVQELRCRVLDVRTRDGAEFMEVEAEGGERLAFRLDRLCQVRTTE